MMRDIFSIVTLIILLLQVNLLARPQSSLLDSLIKLQLPSFQTSTITYFSKDGENKAKQLQNDINQMIEYFQINLGIKIEATLAVLDSDDWQKIISDPYGLPNVTDGIIFMPANSGGFAFHLMQARRESIPVELLKNYLKETNQTFEDLADNFVDLIGFHELGHVFSDAYGINSKFYWLNELIASYFSYTFISEQKPEAKQVFDLLGRPSVVKPKNTTLEDFERLYSDVDDYGWYQGMFESRIKQLYPETGIKFLIDLKREFPKIPDANKNHSNDEKRTLNLTLLKLEIFAPGFYEWAKKFN